MKILLYMVFLTSMNNTSASLIIENLKSIVDFYENDIGVEHLTIDLFSSVSDEDFDPILVEIKQNFPSLQFTYTRINIGKQVCQTSKSDLGIMIPLEVLELKSGKLKYSFQSNVKNVFGTMEFDLKFEKANFIINNLLIFATSIGN